MVRDHRSLEATADGGVQRLDPRAHRSTSSLGHAALLPAAPRVTRPRPGQERRVSWEAKLGLSAAVAIGALAVAHVVALVRTRGSDGPTRYHVRRVAHFAALLVAIVAVLVIWHAFAGRTGVVIGLFAAGIAFAMQEVIGALFGWVNILSGGIYRVGDRVELGGVQGDVIDITPLRTKILEMGQPPTLAHDDAGDGASWVRGRQSTGRIAAISNKTTFTEPVFNYSALLPYIWEELTLPISYRSDWRRAEAIVREEVERVSATEGARGAIETMARRYPVPHSEVEPAVYGRMTDNWWELSARFVVELRTSRTVKSQLARRLRERFDAEGIELSSTTTEVFVHHADSPSARA
jgi:small-conductance mechanosensitive channel